MDQEVTSRTLLKVASTACQPQGSQEGKHFGTMHDIQLSDSTAAAVTGQAHSQAPPLLQQHRCHVLSDTALPQRPDQHTQAKVHKAELQPELRYQTPDQAGKQQPQQCNRPEQQLQQQQQQQPVTQPLQQQPPQCAAAGSSMPSADGPMDCSVRGLLQQLMRKHQHQQRPQQLWLLARVAPTMMAQQQCSNFGFSAGSMPSTQQLLAPPGLQAAATLRDTLIELVSQQVLHHLQQHPQQELPAVLQQQCRLLLHQVRQRMHQDDQLIMQLQRLLLGAAAVPSPTAEAAFGAVVMSNAQPEAATTAAQHGRTNAALASSQHQQQQQQHRMQEAVHQQSWPQLRTGLVQSHSVSKACSPSDSTAGAAARLAGGNASALTATASGPNKMPSAAVLDISLRASPAWQQLAPATQEQLQQCLHSLEEETHPAVLQQQQQQQQQHSLRAVPGQVQLLRCQRPLPAALSDAVRGSFTSTQTYDRPAAAASDGTANASLLQHLASASNQLLGSDLRGFSFSSETTPFGAGAAEATCQAQLQQPAFASQASVMHNNALRSSTSQVSMTGVEAVPVGQSFTQQRQQQQQQQQPIPSGLQHSLSGHGLPALEIALQPLEPPGNKGPDISTQHNAGISATAAAAVAAVPGSQHLGVDAAAHTQLQTMNASTYQTPEDDWSAQQGQQQLHCSSFNLFQGHKLKQQQQQQQFVQPQALPQQGAGAPGKRKRGRPRKHLLQVPEADESQAPAKRGKEDTAAAAQTVLEDQGAIPALKAALQQWGVYAKWSSQAKASSPGKVAATAGTGPTASITPEGEGGLCEKPTN